MILVSEADIFLSESLRILAERLSQSEIGLPLRQICYYSPPEEVGVFSTEMNQRTRHRRLPDMLSKKTVVKSRRFLRILQQFLCLLLFMRRITSKGKCLPQTVISVSSQKPVSDTTASPQGYKRYREDLSDVYVIT